MAPLPLLSPQQVLERAPLRMQLQLQAWCTQWPMPAPWANWRRAAAMRSVVVTRRPFVLNYIACNWRPSTGERAWCTAWWSTSPLTCQDPKTLGSGAAAAPMWNSERSSLGISWMPERPTRTSMPEWGCIIIELADRWVEVRGYKYMCVCLRVSVCLVFRSLHHLLYLYFFLATATLATFSLRKILISFTHLCQTHSKWLFTLPQCQNGDSLLIKLLEQFGTFFLNLKGPFYTSSSIYLSGGALLLSL